MTETGVVVIGAGFAGLAAAHALHDAGVDVAVLEARESVGGRVASQLNGPGERVDTGGQFFCEDMPEVTKLARRFGGRFIETPTAGRTVLRPPAAEGDSVRNAGMAIRERMEKLDLADPKLARTSAADWLGGQPDEPEAKAGFRSMVQGLWCRPLGEIPLAYLAGNDRRVTNETWELQWFLAGTMHGLAESLAEALGGIVRLGTPAERIRHGPQGVAVEAGGRTFQARAALVALPPLAAGRLIFAPAPPQAVSDALGSWIAGWVVKLTIRYKEAFWRGKGLSGTVMWREPAGLFVCDASHATERPGLVMFAGGPLAREWRTGDETAIRAEAAKRLVEGLGEEAAGFLDMTVRDWTDDPWSLGGYADLIALDAPRPDAEGVLREGFGSVCFASSELSPSFPGYVEGAIVSGRLAAEQVRRLLG